MFGTYFVEYAMNDRIDELKRQAIMWCDQNIPGEFDAIIGGYGHHWEEKFAELIVKECINKVRSRQMFGIEDEHNIHHAFDLLVYDLESYFGVEE